MLHQLVSIIAISNTKGVTCRQFLCIFNAHCVKSVQMRSFIWSLFSRIWTEYGDLLCKSPYSFRMRENLDQKKLRILTLFTHWLSLKLVDVNFCEITNISLTQKSSCVGLFPGKVQIFYHLPSKIQRVGSISPPRVEYGYLIVRGKQVLKMCCLKETDA